MEKFGLSKNTLLDNGTQQNGLESCFNGLLDGAIGNPVKALSQIGEQVQSLKTLQAENPKASTEKKQHEKNCAQSKDSVHNKSAYELGTVVGSVLPYAVVSLMTRRLSSRLLGTCEIPTLKRAVIEHSSTGFVIGSLLTPSEKTETDFGRSRLSQGLNSAFVFASMGATGHGMSLGLPAEGKILATRLTRNLIVASTAGAAGGVVDAELSSHLKASPEQILNHAVSYAAFGTAMELGVAHFSRASLPAEPKEQTRSKASAASLEDEYTQILRELGDSSVSMSSNAPGRVEEKSVQGRNKMLGKAPVEDGCKQTLSHSPSASKNALKDSSKTIVLADSESEKLPEREGAKNNPSVLIKRHLFELEKSVKERLMPDEEMKRYRENVMLELKRLNYLEGEKKGFNLHSVLMHLPGMTDAQKVRLADVLTLVNKCTVDGGLSEQSWSRAKSAFAEELKFARRDSAFQSGAEENLLLHIFAQLKTPHNEELKSPAVDFETIAYANQIMRKVGYSQSEIQALDAKLAIARCNPCKNNVVSARPGIENYANYIDVESKKISDHLESNESRKTKLRDAADYYLEKERFDKNLDEKFESEKRLSRLSFLEERFERLGHSDKEKARFYWELNRILDFDHQNSPFSFRERRDLIEQVLNHAAFPTTVKQGANNTCNVATCESRIYSRTPHQMARLIADLSENGTFRTTSGKILDMLVSLSGLRPDAEARECIKLQNKMNYQNCDVKIDKNRDWASQLVQLTLAKIKHLDGVKLFDAREMTEFDEEKLVYDSDGRVQGMVQELDDVVPLVKSNGKPNEEPSKGQKHFMKSGPFIQEVDPANLVYDKYSEIIGCLVKSNKMLRLFDKGGNSVRDFDKSATNFFGPDGNLSLFQNRAGTLTYDKLITRSSFRYTPKQFELERLHVTHLGNRLFVHERNRFGEYRMVSGPEIAAANLLNICNQVTGTEDKSFVLCRVNGEPFISRRQIEVVNVEQLHEALCKLQNTQQFPAIVRVDTRNAPWNQEHGGGHVLNVRDYSPEQKLVRLTNQWDNRSNLILQKMPLENLLEAMRLRVDLDKKSPD